MSNWITDRPPTEADGDADGDVLVQMRPDSALGTCLHWAHVAPWAPWRHTTFWKEPVAAPEPATPTTQPRRFVSISRTILNPTTVILDAIDDEGVAWTRTLNPIPPQPPWKRIVPLPARDLPTEPQF